MVLSVAVSPVGDLVASGGTDDDIQLWSVPEGRSLGYLEGHVGEVCSLAITPDGETLISGGGDQSVRFWNLPDGELLASRDAHNSKVTALALSRDGGVAASVCGDASGHDHSIRVWSIPDGTILKTLYGHERYVSCLALSPDSRSLASGGGDCTVRIWASELERVSGLPVRSATLQDLETAQRRARSRRVSDVERAAWELIARLLRRSRRRDVVLEDSMPRVMQVGEFDVEIEE
jgi:WD40 repeat protein